MKDPYRIPGMLDALGHLWEARPDLTLPRLLGLLETHGAGWNATDEETLTVLRRLCAETPARLRDIPGALDDDGGVHGRYLVTTEDSGSTGHAGTAAGRLVTLGPGRAAVRTLPATRRQALHELPQPVVWDHAGVRSCSVAQPLVILDTSGVPHHLGLVSSIRTVTAPASDGEVRSLTGLRRATLDTVHLLELGDAGDSGTVLVDRSLWLFTAGRRELHREKLDWSRLDRASVGEPLRVQLTHGGVRELAVVERITRLE
ncbi:hypothetical protein [Corynebacterium provencense]|uniref:hypothetical protein n=1 Tax=Corynebacterium provencense TaxID=1737425 RepID=UPI00082B321C|nr:hypothetical protein [Corynebacterium provencense]